MTGFWDGMNERMGRAFIDAMDESAGELAEVTAPPLEIHKNSYSILMSREMLLDMGMVEPTPEEKAERDEQMRVFRIRQNERALIREAAWAQLRVLTEPAVKAVLELHAMADKQYGDPECAHCYWDTEMGYHADWPCETVTAIANAYGIELP